VKKVIVITGASAGIGAAAAERLARDGHAVVLVARRAAALGEVAARCGPDALAITADASRRDDVRRVVAAALERFSRIDVWINNVGRGISRLPTELTDQDIDDVVQLNVKPALYGMQEVLPHFKERGDGQIINVSSMLGRVPFATIRSAYCGAKHFLNALTATFRAEVQQTHPGIQFTIVSPPVVRTDFGLNALHGGPDSRSLPDSQSAEEVADVIAWAVASRRPDIYTRAGSSGRIAAYYAALGEDPPAR
jgi:NADP-dependent 3-hydroxy acid dehydrogenase YdfG